MAGRLPGRGSLILPSILFLLVILAGCLGEAPPEPGNGDDGAGDDDGTGPASGTATGSIQGRVLTDGLDAIAAANIYLLANGTLVDETESGEDGDYAFADIAPGDYRLRFEHPCCDDDVKPVFVEAGKTESVEVQLRALPTPRTDVDEREWHGFMGCGVGSNTLTCGDPQHDVDHRFEEAQGLMGFVIAMDWNPSGTSLSGELRLRVQHNVAGGNWYTYADLRGPPPLETVINATGHDASSFTEIGEHPFRLRFLVQPNGGTDVVYQQAFVVHHHVYYGHEPDDDASAMPG